MVAIAAFEVAEQAHLCRIYLASQGLNAHLKDENTIQWFWYLSGALGGVRLMVAQEDRDRAELLLREYRAPFAGECAPGFPPRFWPVILVLSLFVGAPCLLFGRRRRTGRRGDA